LNLSDVKYEKTIAPEQCRPALDEQEAAGVMTETAFVEPPLTVTDPAQLEWSDAADVVVIGFGCAGASAAIEAREHRADVLVVDRFEGGGATAYSGGIYYAGNTPYQRAAGYDDDPEQMARYLAMEIGDAVREDTLRRFCAQSAENLQWLEAHGVPFNGKLFKGKTTFPPGDHYLYFSGNEKIERYSRHAKPAPRGHRIFGKGWTGKVLFAALADAARRLGVGFNPHARAQRLVLDSRGRVLGIEVVELPEAQRRDHQALYRRVDPMQPFGFDKAVRAIDECRALEAACGERRLIRARRGVVLATGGFAYNLDMLREHLPKYAEHAAALLRLGSMGCDGSGLQLARSAGAAVDKMQRLFAGRSIAPPFEQLRGIIVNRDGRRFINEDAYNATLGEAIANQPGSSAWLILDGRTFWAVVRRLLPRGDGFFMTWYVPALLNILFGGTRRAPSMAALARKCGIDAAGLERELSDYNDAARSGRVDAHGKLADYVQPIAGRSYYALNMSMPNRYSFMLFFTLGGVKVDEDSGLVLKSDGTSIPGLYAAGRVAVGVCSNSYACSGLSLADGVFSGRRAGRHCATGVG
jgi:3-oxo-5alpha-steroid 4-dehydrogenase